ncbi:hypothetical protein [Acinetobacter sp. FDAARGOS_495]|uniref:hypothetical protein n=1 Tax=Acinetobacter sp. FDAARGOS_495 TaxID=2420302 RepID=UPI002265C730|nr:hypothetical protein [Acinetobacter sp. FDAARGOS_495]
MPEIQEPFPQSLNQLTVGIHGFGAIGGGYSADLVALGWLYETKTYNCVNTK